MGKKDMLENGTDDNLTVTEDTDELVELKDHNWDSLTALGAEMSANIIDFAGKVISLTVTPSVVDNLGNNKERFESTVKVFNDDIEEISSKLSVLKASHDNKSGPVKDLAEFSEFNNIMVAYNNLGLTLNVLLTPTMGELIIIAQQALENAKGDSNDAE